MDRQTVILGELLRLQPARSPLLDALSPSRCICHAGEGASSDATRKDVLRAADTQVRLQVDVGFGDAVTPEASVVEMPCLLDFPAPRLRVYPRETVVAEKLEAMVKLGMANSRMKDFHDIAVLARSFSFDGELLTRAIRATFASRKTTLPMTTPVALTATFAEDSMKTTQWSGFVRKVGISGGESLAETIAAVRSFVEAPLLAAAGAGPLPSSWQVGSGWR